MYKQDQHDRSCRLQNGRQWSYFSKNRGLDVIDDKKITQGEFSSNWQWHHVDISYALNQRRRRSP